MIRTASLAAWVTLALLCAHPDDLAAAPPMPPARLDSAGDPLPPDALCRLGTTRLRHPAKIVALAFSPDGKALASSDYDGRREGRPPARRVQTPDSIAGLQSGRQGRGGRR